MIALLALAAQALACGALVRALLGADRCVGLAAQRVAITFGLWAGVTSGASVLALRMHQARTVTGFVAALVVCALAWAATRTRRSSCAGDVDAGHVVSTQTVPVWLRTLASVCVTLAFVSCLLYTLGRPHGSWDAWCMWSAKASLLHGPDRTWQQFVVDLGTYEHPPYPFLVPGFLAQWMDALGVRSTSGPIFLALGFVLASGMALGGTLRNLRGSRAAWFGLLMLAGVHQFPQKAADLAADVPLAFYLLGTVTLLQLGIERGRSGPLLLAGACLGCATWTKNEGMLALVCFLLCAVLCSGASRRSASARRIALLLAGALPFLGLTLLLKIEVPALTDLVDAAVNQGSLVHLTEFERYQPVLRKVGKEIFELGNGLVLLLILLAWCRQPTLVPRKDTAGRWLPAALLSILFGYSVVYVTTPLNQDYHLITSCVRLLVHLVPASVFLLVFAIAEREHTAPA